VGHLSYNARFKSPTLKHLLIRRKDVFVPRQIMCVKQKQKIVFELRYVLVDCNSHIRWKFLNNVEKISDFVVCFWIW
jgi:hypothetical protein